MRQLPQHTSDKTAVTRDPAGRVIGCYGSVRHARACWAFGGFRIFLSLRNVPLIAILTPKP